ncbi:MAG: alpha amylase C-terminal domain-containing protein [Anaerolineae bacterium]|nr:alpha amylase C-terminal domain-containing protein [Anaerolineae bacterium]
MTLPELTAPAWVADSIFYQIFPERFANGDPSNDPAGVVSWESTPTRENFFGGDLQGILDRLPYLEQLGINAIYMTPVFKARSNHKYDTCDYMTVDPAFGSNELLGKLIDSAHNRGIRIVLDAVFNHCGDGFWAFEDVAQRGKQSPYWDWFMVRDYPLQMNPPSYQTCGGAAFLPKLNTRNLEVQDYLLKVAAYWIKEYGIDGWRLDVPWKADFDFWRRFRDVVKGIDPQSYIVGEFWRDAREWLAGDTCDAVMNYPLRDTILDFSARDSMDGEDFGYEVNRLQKVYGNAAGVQLNLLGSHDTARILTVCREDVGRTQIAATALFTTVGVPMVYYGDEIGMTGENDPDCRKPMQWDSAKWNPALTDTYRRLIKARKQHPALVSGEYESLWTFNGISAYRRYNAEEQLVVILNPRDARNDITIAVDGAGTWCDLLSDREYHSSDGQLRIGQLAATSALVLHQAK